MRTGIDRRTYVVTGSAAGIGASTTALLSDHRDRPAHPLNSAVSRADLVDFLVREAVAPAHVLRAPRIAA